MVYIFLSALLSVSYCRVLLSFSDLVSDLSLRDLTSRILPLATSYTAITTFIQQRSHLEHGLVNHALCASIRSMLKVWTSRLKFTTALTTTRIIMR